MEGRRPREEGKKPEENRSDDAEGKGMVHLLWQRLELSLRPGIQH